MKDQRVDLGLSYEDALHGVQTAIQFELDTKASQTTEPKHLRVGIDSAHISDAAIVRLLLKKGVITQAELDESLRIQANDELAHYERQHAPVKFR